MNEKNEKDNLKVVITADTKGYMMEQVEKILQEKLPDWTQGKALIIEVVDTK